MHHYHVATSPPIATATNATTSLARVAPAAIVRAAVRGFVAVCWFALLVMEIAGHATMRVEADVTESHVDAVVVGKRGFLTQPYRPPVTDRLRPPQGHVGQASRVY